MKINTKITSKLKIREYLLILKNWFFVFLLLFLALTSTNAKASNPYSTGHEDPVRNTEHQTHLQDTLPTVILREFLVPNPDKFINGRAIAFDGKNLFITYAGTWNPAPDF